MFYLLLLFIPRAEYTDTPFSTITITSIDTNMTNSKTIDLTEDDDVTILLHASAESPPSQSVNQLLSDLDNFDLYDSDDEEERPQIAAKRRASSYQFRRNPAINAPYRVVEQYFHRGHNIKPNDTVELANGSFLLIRKVIVNTLTGAVMIRGNQLQRTRALGGVLIRKLNECAMIMDVDLDDPRDAFMQSIIEVPLEQVLRVRNVRFTNCNFPGFRMIPNGFTVDEARYLEFQGGLTVRWIIVSYYNTAQDRQQGRRKERILRRVQERESSPGFSVPTARLHSTWRRPSNGNPAPQSESQKYRFADAFCGAGGASRGAAMAGAEVVAGFDFDKLASEAWSKNFPEAMSCCLSADEFVSMGKAMQDELVSTKSSSARSSLIH